jgi:hypothetical protein
MCQHIQQLGTILGKQALKLPSNKTSCDIEGLTVLDEGQGGGQGLRLQSSFIATCCPVPCRHYQCDTCVRLFTFCLGSRFWTQGLALARTALYHLSQARSPFCFSYFSNLGSHVFALSSLDHDPVCSSCITRMTAVWLRCHLMNF